MTDTLDTQKLAARPAAVVPSSAYYVLIVLTFIYGLNFLDRTIFNVLIEPIKKEFALSDTMMGLLAGFGFVLMYSLLGMPIARLADRRDRRSIVATGLAFWSAMTVLCGLAQNVVVLALARIGVGIGESAGTPASQAMISDLFPKDQRPRALGIYAIGTYLGVFLGYFVGGWVSHYYGWRAAFLTAGLPGLLLALLLRFTIAEPIRANEGREPQPPLGETCRFLLSQKTFVLVLIGFCLTAYTNYATSAWIPPFLARVHHLSAAQIGTYAGTFKGLFGIAGTLAGGFVVARVGRVDDRWKLWAPAIMSGLAGPLYAWCLLTDSFAACIALIGATSFFVGFHLGPIFAVVQTVSKPTMRAFAAAAVVLTSTCFGQGIGPLLVGVLNDGLAPSVGPTAVRYSLLTVGVMSTLGAVFFVWAAASIRADILRAGSR